MPGGLQTGSLGGQKCGCALSLFIKVTTGALETVTATVAYLDPVPISSRPWTRQRFAGVSCNATASAVSFVQR